MKELSTRSLMEVHDIIHGQNYVNIKARLDQYLPADYANTFANVNIYGHTGMWFIDDDFPIFRYGDASAIEKEEAAIWLEECRRCAGDVLQEKMPYWRSLFVIPSEDRIFLYRNQSGEVRVVLSEWGFELKGSGRKVDVVGMIIDAPRVLKQEEVTIHIDYSDGTKASQVPFILNSFNNTRNVVTDDDGNFYHGKIFANKKFSISDAQGNNHCEFTVTAGQSIYTAIFDYFVDYVISVENQHGQAKVGCPVKVNGETFQTDEAGNYSGSVKLLPETPLKVAVAGADYEFALEHDSDQNHFTVRVEDPVVPPPPVDEYVTITLLDFDGTPLPDLPFTVTYKKQTVAEIQTDSEGRAKISRSLFTASQKYKVGFVISESYRQQLEKDKQDGKK